MGHNDDHNRPDPDVVLACVEADESQYETCRLKIFLGMPAGVGKTFTKKYRLLTPAPMTMCNNPSEFQSPWPEYASHCVMRPRELRM